MKLDDCLKLNKTSKISISDDKKYLISGVQNYGQGIVIRREVFGSELNMKTYQSISENQLMWCKVDTKNGAFGLTKKEHIGTLASTNMALADIDTSKVDAEFLEILFRQKPFADYITKLSSGSTNRKYLTPKQLFATVEIPDLTLNEQREFVKRVKRIESVKIEEEIQTQKQLISQLKQAILQEAIQGKLTQEWREQNPNTEPASELLERIKAEKEQLIKDKKIRKEKPLPLITENEIPFEIPESWVWSRVGKLGYTQTGTTPAKNDVTNYGNFIPFIQPSNITFEGLDFNCIQLSKKGLEKGRFIPQNSNLMVCIGGSAGKTCYNEVDVSCNQQINTLTALSETSHRYIDISFKSPHFYSSVWSSIKQGSTPILNKTEWSKILIPLPPLEEQKVIVEKVETLMQKCNELQQEITQSEQHANMLMQAVLKEAFESKKIDN